MIRHYNFLKILLEEKKKKGNTHERTPYIYISISHAAHILFTQRLNYSFRSTLINFRLIFFYAHLLYKYYINYVLIFSISF